jgi:hypothetical protein
MNFLDHFVVPDMWKEKPPSDHQHVIDVCDELRSNPKVSLEDRQMYTRFLDRRLFEN